MSLEIVKCRVGIVCKVGLLILVGCCKEGRVWSSSSCCAGSGTS